MATNEFQYLPLDTQSPTFRLLRLRKGDTVKIECDIFHSPVSSPNTLVAYEALSYTWGSGDLVDCVEVDGRKLWITANLYSALLCLRSSDHDRILWIDAICINQSDKLEQGQQVQMMGTIFGSASRVIIWLEKSIPEAMLLMESLNELQTQYATLFGDVLNADKTDIGRVWLQSALETQDDDLMDRLRRGLQYLLERPWFERVWILQEVANARSAVVCSGTLSVSPYIFTSSLSLLDIQPSPHVQSILDIMPQPSRHDSWWTRERELATLLDKFRASKATDKRDMLFALLGMSSEPDHDLLSPNYTIPLHEVLHKAVRYWFELTNIPISQVIHLLTAFETVRVTYLVLPQGLLAPRETVQISSQPETVVCIRDASLLMIEQSEQATGGQRALFEELDEVEAQVVKNGHDVNLRIVSWQDSWRNIKFLIIEHPEKALSEIVHGENTQFFNFVVNKGLENDRNLLEHTMSKAIESVFRGYQGNSTLREVGINRSPSMPHYHTIKLMMDRGTNLDTQGGKYGDLLQAASWLGDVEMVKLLLDRGADINARGKQCTALTAASIRNKAVVAEMLLQKGADVDTKSDWPRKDALQHASYLGCKRTVQILLEWGADVNRMSDIGHKSALQGASNRGHKDIVEILLSKGADVNAQSKLYGSALQAASDGGHKDIIELLLHKGANVNAQGGSFGNAVCAASYRGHGDLVRILLEHGADVDAPGKYGTALEIAKERKDETLMQIFREHKAKKERRKELGNGS